MSLTVLAVSLALATLPNASSNKNALDFWVGTWMVTGGGQKQGDDIVEKWLNGNAIVEHWKDVEGGEGKSFFYFMAAKNQWKQVWVTPMGAYKEKYSELVPDGIRFAGTVYLPNGKSYKDRTTLTKLEDGKVHQIIEANRDGKKWVVTFDAIYSKP